MKQSNAVALGARLLDLEKRVNQLNLRERSILAITLFTVTVVAFSEFHWTDRHEALNRLDGKYATESSQRDVLQATLAGLEHEIEQDPNRLLTQQNRQLQVQLQQQDIELKDAVAQLVQPSEMITVLHSVLKQNNNVNLIELQNLGVEPVFAADKHNSAPAVQLYRHQVRLVFEAGYFDTLTYLEALEQLGTRIMFRQLDYQVTEHPRARVELVVETLGLEKEWLGV